MQALKYDQFDCATLADMLRGEIELIEVDDLSGKVQHVGFGGVAKSKYVSKNTGKTIYVLERNNTYAADAYTNDVWQFDADFSAAEADEFIRLHDSAKA